MTIQIMIVSALIAYMVFFSLGILASWYWWPKMMEFVIPSEKKFTIKDLGYICMFSALAGPMLFFIYAQVCEEFGFKGKDSIRKY